MVLAKEKIKEFEKGENQAEDSYDFRSLADDKEWAKKIYGKAEEKAAENDDFRDLAKSVYQSLGDQKWSNDLYKKAPLTKEEIKEFKETEKDAEDSYGLTSLAYQIADVGGKDWAKRIYKKAESVAVDYDDFANLANSISENLDDKKFLKDIFKKAKDRANVLLTCEHFKYRIKRESLFLFIEY